MKARGHKAIIDYAAGYPDGEPRSQHEVARLLGTVQTNVRRWLAEPFPYHKEYRGHKVDRIIDANLDALGYPYVESMEDAAIEGAGERRSFKIRGDEATCELFTSDLIRTEQEALDASEVDLEVWESHSLEFGAWGSPMKIKRDGEDVPITVQLYRVAIKFRRRVFEPLLKELSAGLIADLEAIAGELEAFRAGKSRKRPQIATSPADTGVLLAIMTPDIHVGKVPFNVAEDYDAPALHDEAVRTLLARSSRAFDVEQVVFAIGNDALNTDGSRRSTTHGTMMDGLGRWQEDYRRAFKMYVSAILQMLAYAPVKVMVVPGNHDQDSVFYMGDQLESAFAGNPDVSVDTGLDPRKYYSWKEILIGFTHGKDEKIGDLPMLMAVEAEKAWALAYVREWMTGHKHTKEVMETKGVRTRIINSLSPSDEWHKKKGFIGNLRAASGFVYSSRALEAEFVFSA